jgi:hypothetical protein
VLNSPPFSPRPAAVMVASAVLALVAVLVALLIGVGESRAEPLASGPVAAAAVERPTAPAACSKYKRLKRQARQARRNFRTRLAGTPSRTRRAKLRRVHRARTARRVAAMRRLARRCARAAGKRRLTSPRGPGREVVSRKAGVRWGLHTNWWGRGTTGSFELDRTREVGVGWIREEFESYPTAATDDLYLNAARRGLRILPLLQTSSVLPTDVDGYASNVAAFARRFGPGGDFWAAHPELDASLASTHFEIYNEPYGDWYGPVEPERFAALLRVVIPRARQANSRARFLIPVDRTPGGERHTWIDDLYRAEPRLNELFDGVAMHPYSGNRAPDEPDDPWGFVRVTEARSALQAHGAGDKEFWITEIGWSTCPADPEWCVSEAQQAANMERLAELVRTRYTFVDAVFFYHFIGSEENPDESQDFFGLVHSDYSPKPGLHALRRIAAAG